MKRFLRLPVLKSAFIIVVILAGTLLPGLQIPAHADPAGTYNAGDIAWVNSYIRILNLDWPKADPADGSYVPPEWGATTGTKESIIAWSSDATDKRIIDVQFRDNEATESMLLNQLKGLQHFYSNGQLTSINVSENTELTSLEVENNLLTNIDLSNNTKLTNLNLAGNKLSTLDLTNNALLSYLNCSNNQLTEILVPNSNVLQEINCDNNMLTGMDLSTQIYCLNKFCGDGQKPSLTLYYNSATGKYELSIPLENPTNLAAGLKYENGMLIADDTTVTSTPFTVETKMPGPTVTGTMSLEFAQPVYNSGDIAFINALIDNNGLSWDKAPSDGTSIPSSWDWTFFSDNVSPMTGVIWSNDGGNKRIVKLALCRSKISGEVDFGALGELTSLYASENSITSIDVSKLSKLEVIDCGSNQLDAIDVSQNTLLQTLHCDVNQLTGLDVTKNTALLELHCNSNQLTNIDLTNNAAITDFYGFGQFPTLTLTQNHTTGKYELEIPMNNPTDLAAGLTYSDGKLIADDDTVAQSNFTIDPGLASKRKLFGILTLNYVIPEPTYSPHDVAVINYLIDHNNFGLIKADPPDGYSIPWELGHTFAWSTDANNKRLIRITDGSQLTGDVDLSTLDKLINVNITAKLTSITLPATDTLTVLEVSKNQLTALDVTKNPKLTEIGAYNNQLTELDLSNNNELIALRLDNNQITALDLGEKTKLQFLKVDNNKITEIDLSNSSPNLYMVNVSGNKLTAIDLSNKPMLVGASLGLDNQTPSLTLYKNRVTGKYELSIALNNPTDLASGLTYENGKLIADDNTLTQSPFAVETGLEGNLLSGTLSLNYEILPLTYTLNQIGGSADGTKTTKGIRITFTQSVPELTITNVNLNGTGVNILPDSLKSVDADSKVWEFDVTGDFAHNTNATVTISSISDLDSTNSTTSVMLYRDVVAPVLSNGTLSRTSDTAATIGFTTDDAATAYYYVTDNGTTAPDKADIVKNGTSLGTVSKGDNSGLAITLTKGAKDVYVTVTDAEGNIATPIKLLAGLIDATLTKAPVAVTGLKFNGKAQTLVTAGAVSGGYLEYAVVKKVSNTTSSSNSAGNEETNTTVIYEGETVVAALRDATDLNYSSALPTATESGDYTVYYRIQGDINHNSVTNDAWKINVTIAKSDSGEDNGGGTGGNDNNNDNNNGGDDNGGSNNNNDNNNSNNDNNNSNNDSNNNSGGDSSNNSNNNSGGDSSNSNSSNSNSNSSGNKNGNTTAANTRDVGVMLCWIALAVISAIEMIIVVLHKHKSKTLRTNYRKN
ncbi:MAG: hypothetical protein LBQ95_01580 [Lachnospiraceae bacterium]|jgi:Leucine-rich repeat (LRR) protein|nr:hypothetical protein [Lachnospiraceae bacterium]